MSATRNLFRGKIDEIAGIDLDAPVSALGGDNHALYAEAFAKAADGAGDTSIGHAYRFVGCLCGFMEGFSDTRNPYRPVLVMTDGTTSPVPTDLAPGDVEALAILASLAKEPWLRARLHDVLWLRSKSLACCREAVLSFRAAAVQQEVGEHWPQANLSLQRALQLAGFLLRKEPQLFADTIVAIEGVALARLAQHGEVRPLGALRLLRTARKSAPQRFLPLIRASAERAAEKGDHYREERLREEEMEWYRAFGMKDELKAAQIRHAESVLRQGEDRLSGGNKSALAASSFLARGVELLQRAGAPAAAIEAAKRRLNQVQPATMDEMESFVVKTDISDLIGRAQAHVANLDFQEALRRLALAVPLANPTEVRKSVLEHSAQNPFASLVATSLVDSKGRTIAKKDALLTTKGTVSEESIAAATFEHAARFIWSFRVQAFIAPARLQVLNDHHPTMEDLQFLVRGNPFVPPGHEHIFLTGLHAGFHGDWAVATHLLVPQIENSIRQIAENHCIDVSIISSDGTQPLRTLGGLLALPKIREIFGEGIVFELQGILIEKTGFDLRNHVAHGFVSYSECYSGAAELAWWHVFRLCLLPVLAATKAIAPPADPVA